MIHGKNQIKLYGEYFKNIVNGNMTNMVKISSIFKTVQKVIGEQIYVQELFVLSTFLKSCDKIHDKPYVKKKEFIEDYSLKRNTAYKSREIMGEIV